MDDHASDKTDPGDGTGRVDAGVDLVEWYYEQGYSDGLPVVPPTPEKVAAAVAALGGDPEHVECRVPPRWGTLTREILAVNAVMAGCLPGYLPVVRAALLALTDPAFNLNGVQATTHMAAPLLVVNGLIRAEIGMNAGCNVFGSGNRANATIGRALQLVVRNVGGGRPGEVDRACFGNPGKYTLCFAEDEDGSPWTPLSVERGFSAQASTVTLFGGEGPRVVVDQLSRDPRSLASSLAACLRTVIHPKLPIAFDVVLVVSPEHARVFSRAGWDKARLRQELLGRLMLPGAEIVRGAGGIAEGVPEAMKDQTLPKFRPQGLLIVHAGGSAGLFSAILGGWINGATGTNPVTVEIRP